jgi:hypothetical protein
MGGVGEAYSQTKGSKTRHLLKFEVDPLVLSRDPFCVGLGQWVVGGLQSWPTYLVSRSQIRSDRSTSSTIMVCKQ